MSKSDARTEVEATAELDATASLSAGQHAYHHKLSAARVVADRAAASGAPYGAMVEIADRCNEACVHCYQVQGQKGELETAQWERIFDELADMGVLFLTISGGEPTLRKDFLHLVAYARRLRFAVKIYSNAINITEAMAAELGRLAVQEVQVSLYSHRAEVHDRVTRVPGSFAKVVAATVALRRAQVKVLLKSPLMKVNAPDYREYVDFVTSLGAEYSLDPKLMHREDGDLGPTRFEISRPAHLAVRRDAKFSLPHKPATGALKTKPCGACMGKVHLEANGEMRPCTQWNIPTGHALGQGVRHAWQNDPAATAIRALTWDQLPACRSCDLRSHCQRCFAEAERHTGNALAPYARACLGARWKYEFENGVEPEIDSDAGQCAVVPVGPFERTGEHRFLVRGSPVNRGSDDPMPIERPWLEGSGVHAAGAQAGPHQLLQLRRRVATGAPPAAAPRATAACP